MQKRAFPRSGTLRRDIFDLIQQHGGLTDDELEKMLHRSHQSVSGARSTLATDGWLKDSGHQRLNRYDNPAIVWIVA
jgi:Mn-dependent DtxR family transcriptional regulator